MKLGLGTVQFGLSYGISNKNGQVPLEEIKKILDQASLSGINILDTAQGYGTSEQVLGKFDLSKFKIVSKLNSHGNIETSLKNLNLSSIYALLYHNENELNSSSFQKLLHYKESNLVEKIGISVYSSQKLAEIINNFPIDIVQLPLNLLDQRFIPLLSKLKEKNIEIHVRSVFLQGLVLMDLTQVPSYFDPIKPILEQLPQNRIQTCLNFVKRIKEIDHIIVGTTNLNELNEIIENYTQPMQDLDFSKFKIEDEKFILPMNWEK